MALCPILGRLLLLMKEFSSPTEKGVWNEKTRGLLTRGLSQQTDTKDPYLDLSAKSYLSPVTARTLGKG